MPPLGAQWGGGGGGLAEFEISNQPFSIQTTLTVKQ